VRSAKGLQQLLRGYFGFPRVRVVQFASAWVDIPVPTRLGSGETLLGRSVRLGHRMEDLLSRFIVEIGPLARAGFERFLPAEDALLAPFRTVRAGRDGHDRQEGRDGAEPVPALVDRVRDLVDAYLRDPLHYEVKVLLDPGRTPPAVLGSPDARLGMGLWLGTRPAGEIACRL
jgi:predicted component of type VI protein secretion system